MLTASTVGCQAPQRDSQASSGRKISAPVAVLALSRPMTRPWRVANQRLTTAAPSTEATAPEPKPASTPQVSIYCQAWVIHRLAKVLADMSARPAIIVRRMPKLCISAAANGPTSP